MGLSFPRKEKLKSKKLIEQLFAKGNSVSNYPIKLIYLKTELPFDVPIQAGVTVPKKKFIPKCCKTQPHQTFDA